MRDPVTLPKSGVNVDRSTIKRHLMNKETDPFNNTHLTLGIHHYSTPSYLIHNQDSWFMM
jgi:hypothetical protein